MMLVKLISSDNKELKVEEDCFNKSLLLKNMINVHSYSNGKNKYNNSSVNDMSIEIPFTHKILSIIYNFMLFDKTNVLHENYNPIRLHFPEKYLEHIKQFSIHEIIDICKASCYLEYPFLMELCSKVIANDLQDVERFRLSIICGLENNTNNNNTNNTVNDLEFEWDSDE